jgi:hypothetical protein
MGWSHGEANPEWVEQKRVPNERTHVQSSALTNGSSFGTAKAL